MIEQINIKESGVIRRMIAFLIDIFVITSLVNFIVFIFYGKELTDNLSYEIYVALSFGFLSHFVKDSIKGISIGKWIAGIMVRDDKDYDITPSFGRLFLRNLFLLVWPVELIKLAVSDEKKRFGDVVLHTVVLKNPKRPEAVYRIIALILVVFSFIFASFYIGGNVIKNSEAYKVSIERIKKNKKIVKEVGGIKEFGSMPAASFSINNGREVAQIRIQVIGNKRIIFLTSYLEKQPNGHWKLIGIYR